MSVANVTVSQTALVSGKTSLFQKWDNLGSKIGGLIRSNPNLLITGMGLLNTMSFFAALGLNDSLRCKVCCLCSGKTWMSSALIAAPMILSSAFFIGGYKRLSDVISHKTAEPKAETRVYSQSYKTEAICAAIGAIGLILFEAKAFELPNVGLFLSIYAQHSAYVKTHILNALQSSRQNVREQVTSVPSTPQKETTKTASFKPLFQVNAQNFKGYVTKLETAIKNKRTDLPIAKIWETLRVGYSQFPPAQQLALKPEYEKGARLFKEYKPAVGTATTVSAIKPKAANANTAQNVSIKR